MKNYLETYESEKVNKRFNNLNKRGENEHNFLFFSFRKIEQTVFQVLRLFCGSISYLLTFWKQATIAAENCQ